MPTRIDELLDRIAELEHELESELNEVATKWRYRIERDRGCRSDGLIDRSRRPQRHAKQLPPAFVSVG
jgi:hypothetical protein